MYHQVPSNYQKQTTYWPAANFRSKIRSYYMERLSTERKLVITDLGNAEGKS